MRITVPQNDFINDVAALYATHGHEPVSSQALPDIHTAFIDQESPAAETRASFVQNGSNVLSGSSG
jgi:hypothetical protein